MTVTPALPMSAMVCASINQWTATTETLVLRTLPLTVMMAISVRLIHAMCSGVARTRWFLTAAGTRSARPTKTPTIALKTVLWDLSRSRSLLAGLPVDAGRVKEICLTWKQSIQILLLPPSRCIFIEDQLQRYGRDLDLMKALPIPRMDGPWW